VDYGIGAIAHAFIDLLVPVTPPRHSEGQTTREVRCPL
jgi:hypothetical protein